MLRSSYLFVKAFVKEFPSVFKECVKDFLLYLFKGMCKGFLSMFQASLKEKYRETKTALGLTVLPFLSLFRGSYPTCLKPF